MKPVRIIVTKSAGSVTDFIGHALSDQFLSLWDQRVTVENHPGAGGATGVAIVAKAVPDGYTLLVHSSGYVVNQLGSEKPAQEALQDFVDIAPIANQPLALVVGPKTGLKSVSEVIAAVKAKPGELKYGTPGTGSAAFIAGEKLKKEAGIDVVHVPYKGGPETVAATKNGSVTYSFLPFALALKGERAGKLLTLAITSAERAQARPDLPTIAEAGFPGVESTVWWGLWAPAGIPAHVENKLSKDIAHALSTPEMLRKLEKRKLEPMSMTSAEFERFVRSEMEGVQRIFEEAGVNTK